ncbi:c-type cytochrome biogenesis protein CcsB [Phosphitispora sp. TUW77]|uniref:c-type cytochrome biogenesis protein CcsB n=1 Tax=Phosphitispora sp. TUW77 TaxID=3152361 RepID=UPI003AB5F7C4
MDLIALEQQSFTATFIAYGVASLIYVIYLAYKNESFARLGTIAAIIGLITNTAFLFLRWKISGHAPFVNGYEFLLSFTWGIAAIYLFAEWRYRMRIIGAFVMPIAWFILAWTAMSMPEYAKNAGNLMPALQSNWLTIHVATAMLAYGAFALSCGTSIMYIIKKLMEDNNSRSSFNKRMPSLDILDDISYKAIAVGFPLLSAVIITGAIWAEYAWGRYWSWDPKETWSLITWLVYAAYLHARFTYGWRGNKAAWMSVLGFVFVLFTFFGVNYFLSGLHAYGGL